MNDFEILSSCETYMIIIIVVVVHAYELPFCKRFFDSSFNRRRRKYSVFAWVE